ncbi:MAG TPA: PepSY-like domain-containing protein [Puia sp.]|nr:PepSY-like domain-containing protein [Puia sp.]
MKRLVFFLVAAALAAPTFAAIPARVTDALAARYGHATNVEWKHMVAATKYEANFDLGKYRMDAWFDAKGKWLKSEKTLRKDMLPVSVKYTLDNSKYRQWKIRSSYESYSPGEKPAYFVKVKNGLFESRHLKFDDCGRMIKA